MVHRKDDQIKQSINRRIIPFNCYEIKVKENRYFDTSNNYKLEVDNLSLG